MSISRRGKKGLFTHSRRRPIRYESIDSRDIIRTALYTSNEDEAREKASKVERLQDLMWEATLAGRGAESTSYYERLQSIAEMRGFRYQPASESAALPLDKLLDRIEAAATPAELDATIGMDRGPQLHLSGLFEVFEELTEDRHTAKSADQLKRWRAVRIRAISNLQSVLGDLAVENIDRDMALRFRAWWWGRIKSGQLAANSGNKDITYLSGMISQVCMMRGMPDHKPFAGLRFREEENRRLSFSKSWISDKLLRPGALSGMNEQARDVLLVMVNTGARPSEIVNLQGDAIDMSANVPSIEIRPEGRELKTRHSRRTLPLVGVSLEAMRRHPTGFPRYHDKSATWSNQVNKFLRVNGLLETPKHSAYSLRHSINDALVNAGCEDRIRKDILGHRGEGGVIYGSGAALETKLKWLAKVAYV